MKKHLSFKKIFIGIIFSIFVFFGLSLVSDVPIIYAQECTGQFGATQTYDVGDYTACPAGSCGSMWCKTGTLTCTTWGAGGYASNGVCQTYTDCGMVQSNLCSNGACYTQSAGSCDTSNCKPADSNGMCSGGISSGSGGYCGDTYCNNGETSSSCSVDCPVPTNFTVSLSPTTANVYNNGGYAYYALEVIPSPWQSGQAYTLSFNTCPVGVTCAFNDGSNITSTTNSYTSTSWDGSESTVYNNASKQIKLTSTKGTPPGTYAFSIRATKNGVSKDVTGWVVITAPNSSCSSISVPSSVLPGQSFNATVTMYNSGSTVWTNGAYGAPRDGVFTYPRPDAAKTWGSNSSQFIPQTNYYDTTSVSPGYSYTFTVPSVAPVAAGYYNYSTQMYHYGSTASDQFFFGAVCNGGSVQVVVPPPVAAAPVVYLNVNPTSASEPGGTTVSWTATNNPTSCTATGGYGTTWAGTKSSSGTQDVTWYPEGNYTFTLSCTNAYGTGTNSKSFTVTNTGTNDSSCSSIVAPTSVIKGQTFTAYVTMKNTGTKSWNNVYTSQWDQAHKLGSSNPIDNVKWGAASQRTLLPTGTTSVPPGQSVTFTLNSLIAPTTIGTYSLDFKMVEEAVQWFGQQCSTNVSVVDAPTQYSLSTTKTIGGTITTTDGQISCGTVCTKQYNQGSSVTLRAVPDTYYWKFIGWGGACSGKGTGDCVITINGNTTVTAQFRPKSLLYQEF